MLPELSQIKRKRRQLGLTQAQLAKQAGISQSLMAKIEAGQLQPAYDKVKRIFDALSESGTNLGQTAKDLMNRRILTVKPSDSVKKAVQLMEKHAISQLPVISAGKSLGLITEKIILNALNKPKTADLSKAKVRAVMSEALPTISADTPERLVTELLLHHNAALVTKKGKILGIISKTDLFKNLV